MWEINLAATATVDGDTTSIQLSRISGNVQSALEEAQRQLKVFQKLLPQQVGMLDQLKILLEISESRWETKNSTTSPIHSNGQTRGTETSPILPSASAES